MLTVNCAVSCCRPSPATLAQFSNWQELTTGEMVEGSPAQAAGLLFWNLPDQRQSIHHRLSVDDTYHVYYLGDFDRAGHDAARALEEKLTRFAHEEDIEVIFEQIAVTKEQVKQWGLTTREPKIARGRQEMALRPSRTIHLRLPEMT